MKKAVSLITALAAVFLLSACGAGRTDINKAHNFLSGLSSLKEAGPIGDMDTFIEYSASVINLPFGAFDVKTGWEKKSEEYEKYLYIFNSDGTLSLYFTYGKLDKVTYTFIVDSTSDIFDTGKALTGLYGDPVVTLNSVDSSQDAVRKAIDSGGDPDLRYCYEWLAKQDGKTVYIYLAYYYNNGTNFAYIVVSNPNKNDTYLHSPKPEAP